MLPPPFYCIDINTELVLVLMLNKDIVWTGSAAPSTQSIDLSGEWQMVCEVSLESTY